MADTWFVVTKADADGKFFVMRLDRKTLPEGTVIAGPFLTEKEATEKQIRAEEREICARIAETAPGVMSCGQGHYDAAMLHGRKIAALLRETTTH